MKVHPHSLEGQAQHKATHYCDVDYTDLAAGTGNTLTLSPVTVADKMAVELVKYELLTAFDFSDATLISNAITVGDGGSATRFLSSTETAADGTTIYVKGGALTEPTGRYVYTTGDTVDVFFTGTSGKVLNTATQGKFRLHFNIDDARKPAV